MKKSLLLLSLAAFLTATSGCWHWLNRGASCGNACPPAGCGGGGYGGGDPYLGPPAALPAEGVLPAPQ